MPRPGKDLRKLTAMAKKMGFDVKQTIDETRVLLEEASQLRWQLLWQNDEMCKRLSAFGHGEFDRGLLWLDAFAPSRVRRSSVESIRCMGRNRFVLQLLEQAVLATRQYPEQGDLYERILRGCYLEDKRLTEQIFLAQLNMDRSTFYARKREAVLCCGLALFGGLALVIEKG